MINRAVTNDGQAGPAHARNWWAPAGLTLLWWLAALLVDPRGDFPVFDDWHYGLLVRSLWEEGRFVLWDDISPNLFLQPFWGWLFCWVAGSFSFFWLRLSTLVLGWISVLLVFFLLRPCTDHVKTAFWGALALAFCPMFFLLSPTFMTDIPFLAGCLASVWAFERFLRSGAPGFRLAAYLFALAAYLTRLPGIFIIPAWEGAMWLAAKDKRRQWPWLAGGLAFSILVFFLMESWIKPAVGLRSATATGASILSDRHLQAPFDHLRMFGRNLLRGILLTGFLSLPLFSQLWRQTRSGFLSAPWIYPLLLGSAGFILLLWRLDWIFPFVGEGGVYFNFGLGPLLLRDVYILGLKAGPVLPTWTLLLLGYWATLSGALILLLLVYWLKTKRSDPFFLFLFLFNAAYLLFLASYSYFDRYLLLPFASMLLLLLRTPGQVFPTRANVILIVLGAWFSIAGTHDYLAWNRTVDRLTRRLEERGIPPAAIDGGMAYNGLKNEGTENPEATYWLTFQPLEGYEVILRQDYDSWLFLRERSIWVLGSRPPPLKLRRLRESGLFR